MNHVAAKELIAQGIPVSRISWDACKMIRKAVESDIEFINYPIENVIVEDCNQKLCDCKISIYNFTEDDKKAEDYVRVIKHSSK